MNEIITETKVEKVQFEAEMAYPTIKQGWGIIGLFLLVTIGYAIPVGLLEVMGIDIQSNLFSLLNYVLPLGILILITRSWWGKNPKNKSTLTLNAFPVVILPVVVIMTMAILIINVEITSWVPLPEWLLEMFKDAVKPNIFGFLLVAVAAPILEEVLMRGIVLDGLLKNYRPWKAILWSSIFFGVLHLNPWQFVVGLLVGFALGYLYWKTKSLFLCIFIHFVNNSIGFYLMMRYPDMSNISDLFELGAMARVISFVVAAVVIWQSYRFFEAYFKAKETREI
jgi:membrane protease YdiL (CAAX protease family)